VSIASGISPISKPEMSQFKVAIYLYQDADLLDFSGPAEIYCHYHDMEMDRSKPAPFSVTSFAHQSPVTSVSSAMVYLPNATFAELSSRIEEYDILVIPGAHDDTIKKLISSEEGKELTELIRRFSTLKPRKETGKRFLQSVCTGGLILAASGVLAGRTITTHHLSLDLQKELADEAAGGDSKVNVVRQRWSDAGTTDAGVRIVTAGGVSSGIDTSLWVVEQCYGSKAAHMVSEISEFDMRPAAWGTTT
jgi:putative intracellular protease/amidase